jgi:sugar lactone lactonase YvrE
MTTSTSATTSTLTVVPVPGTGAEDVLVGDDGTVYTGTADGSILAVRPDGDQVTRIARTGGRPLGLEWLTDGRMLVCDAHAGLLALEVATGAIETLLTEVDGRPMVFCNNAAVHPDGTVYFSDSSTVHPIERWKDDVAEDTGTGRLMRRSPDGEVEVLVERLRFANGVALSAAGDFVCVAETTGRTVVRRWLEGPRAGTTDHLVADLPGYPDNIARGTDGLIWVTIASPKDPVVELLHRWPLGLRKAAMRLPEVLQPAPKRTARVMAFDETGAVVHDRSFDGESYHLVTGVREHEGRVWLGSLQESAVAWFDV